MSDDVYPFATRAKRKNSFWRLARRQSRYRPSASNKESNLLPGLDRRRDCYRGNVYKRAYTTSERKTWRGKAELEEDVLQSVKDAQTLDAVAPIYFINRREEREREREKQICILHCPNETEPLHPWIIS